MSTEGQGERTGAGHGGGGAARDGGESGLESSGGRVAVVVGAFIVLLIAGAFAVVFLLGSKRHVFEERVTLHAHFDNVQGLRAGAPVWLAGVAVGRVTAVRFPEAIADRRVRVAIEIQRAALSRVRADSVARIGTQGVLGDKLIELSVGSPEEPGLAPGAVLKTQSPVDLEAMIAEAGEAVRRVRDAADRAAAAVTQIAQPSTIRDVRRAISSLRAIARAAAEGPGLVHALFYDPNTARNFERASAGVDRLIARVDGAVAKVDRILEATDEEGRGVVNQLARAARGVGDVADELARTRTMTNLERASADVAALTARARRGEGTIGALLVDPTVYERLVTILGGVERSRILRAVVRYAIEHSK
jgi:phospholipid/cholesterol/gamma-HCH transport system substrate-binding protein